MLDWKENSSTCVVSCDVIQNQKKRQGTNWKKKTIKYENKKKSNENKTNGKENMNLKGIELEKKITRRKNVIQNCCEEKHASIYHWTL